MKAIEATPRGIDRRGALRLAWAGLLAALGAAAMGRQNVRAADGQSVLLGSPGDAQNHMTSTTSLTADSGSYAAGAAVKIDASTANGTTHGALVFGADHPGFQNVIGGDGLHATGGFGNFGSGGGVIATGATGWGANQGGDGVRARGGNGHPTGGFFGGHGVEATGGSIGSPSPNEGVAGGHGVVGRGGARGSGSSIFTNFTPAAGVGVFAQGGAPDGASPPPRAGFGGRAADNGQSQQERHLAGQHGGHVDLRRRWCARDVETRAYELIHHPCSGPSTARVSGHINK